VKWLEKKALWKEMRARCSGYSNRW